MDRGRRPVVRLIRSSGRGSILRSRPGARGPIRYTALSVDLVLGSITAGPVAVQAAAELALRRSHQDDKYVAVFGTSHIIALVSNARDNPSRLVVVGSSDVSGSEIRGRDQSDAATGSERGDAKASGRSPTPSRRLTPLPPGLLRDPRDQSWGNVFGSCASHHTVKDLLRASGGTGVTYIIPSAEQCPWSPPIGYQFFKSYAFVAVNGDVRSIRPKNGKVASKIGYLRVGSSNVSGSENRGGDQSDAATGSERGDAGASGRSPTPSRNMPPRSRLSREEKGKDIADSPGPTRDASATDSPLDDFDLIHRDALRDTKNMTLS
ncbi:hypothetical protein F2Q68_00030956 [Brassica cretica]|uniref:Uncharacterized protein n=1 Tax=Brassica cretica TaxID=69181 RepID=A0A8S9GH30_BRACR|nr:hypothetical protein F2Q68_00030956 [Brassica cretica]